MTFAWAWVLPVAAGLVAVAAWLAVATERRRREALTRFGDPAVLGRGSALPSPRRSAVLWALRLGALAFGLVALARPQLGERNADLVRTGRDVLVLLDLSRSMLVTDARGTRLAAAKRIAWDLAERAPGDRVGLVVFGGSAFLQLPLTSDRGALRLFLDQASPDDLGDPATDVSAALITAARTFEHEGDEGRRAVVVLSDGESGEGDMDEATAELRRQGLPVFAVGLGSAAGGPVPADSSEAPEKFHRNHIGQIVVSRLEETDLLRAARASGGAFAHWDRENEMRRLEATLDAVRPRVLSARKTSERADRYQWPLAVAVLLLMAGEIMGRRSGRAEGRTGASGRWGTADSARPAGPARDPRIGSLASLAITAMSAAALLGSCSAAGRGERLYQQGKYGEAYGLFHAAQSRDTSARLAFDAGSALYRLERYEEAAEQFRSAARDAGFRQRSLFNLGNAMVRAAEEKPGRPEPLYQAAEAFEGALRLNPGDQDAKWNLEIALRRLGDDRTSGGSSGRGRNADYGQGNMNVPGYEGNPDAAVGAMAGGGFGSAEGESVEELTPEEARRLLEAVQRQQLTSHEGRRNKQSNKGDRDW
ncbi:MAG TPA: VWA domain-containing protein [Gemmatimonadales bacterium]|nr:VWA domain-containing protein [Gemmatimonadales bacterium]